MHNTFVRFPRYVARNAKTVYKNGFRCNCDRYLDRLKTHLVTNGLSRVEKLVRLWLNEDAADCRMNHNQASGKITSAFLDNATGEPCGKAQAQLTVRR